jgi:hypothetical protein
LGLRWKKRKKIRKCWKRVKTPQIKELRMPRVKFWKARELRVKWSEAREVKVKFRNSSMSSVPRQESLPIFRIWNGCTPDTVRKVCT